MCLGLWADKATLRRYILVEAGQWNRPRASVDVSRWLRHEQSVRLHDRHWKMAQLFRKAIAPLQKHDFPEQLVLLQLEQRRLIASVGTTYSVQSQSS